MRVLQVGCCHGQLDRIYAAAKSLKADLVLVAGDFQAARDTPDLESMAVPAKYRRMGDFEKYHSGKCEAPVLTVVIGGNHEASRHMLQHTNGGWLAKNIWYMGRVGVIKVGKFKIGGMSGVYAHEHYKLGHFETLPLDRSAIRSVYHQREEDVQKLLKYEGKLDLIMSHDWPQGAAEAGDLKELLARKPFLKHDISTGKLGSPAARTVLDKFRPKLWQSAHMHIYYESTIGSTRFLALDKAEPRRKFYRLLEVDKPLGPLKVPKGWQKIIDGC